MNTLHPSDTLAFLNQATEKIFRYDSDQYNFPAILRELFECDNLQQLHEVYPEHSSFPLHDRRTNTRTWFHDRFYERLHSGWPELRDTYGKFVQLIAKEFLDEKEIIFQKNPTLRVNVPGNTAAGPFHTDAEFSHPVASLNFVLPLTPMFESNTIVCESVPGRHDFRHIPLEVGDVFHFNGTQCLHGNLINTTGVTRVSFDFRLMRIDDYNPNTDAKSAMLNVPLKVGAYYDKVAT